jgi:hypothetical protein
VTIIAIFSENYARNEKKENWNKFFLLKENYIFWNKGKWKKICEFDGEIVEIFSRVEVHEPFKSIYMNVVECIMDSWKIKNAKWEGK